jgi:hypothetical protein
MPPTGTPSRALISAYGRKDRAEKPRTARFPRQIRLLSIW